MKEETLRDKILQAAKLNAAYMDMPVGSHYPSMVKLYRMIAREGVECARAYVNGDPPPKHSASLDAFLWGNVAWARSIGAFIVDDAGVWEHLFVTPHFLFAQYLKFPVVPRKLQVAGKGLHPADLNLEHDRQWMWLVMKLTARWGLLSHLRYLPALAQSIRLAKHLKPYHRSQVTLNYIRADLAFLRLLFEVFLVNEPKIMKQCRSFLDEAGIQHLPSEYAEWAVKMQRELKV